MIYLLLSYIFISSVERFSDIVREFSSVASNYSRIPFFFYVNLFYGPVHILYSDEAYICLSLHTHQQHLNHMLPSYNNFVCKLFAYKIFIVHPFICSASHAQYVFIAF